MTGRKEDVALAKREILSAADHFSQIRASRKSNINSTLAFGQLMANTPGQTTVQVRVPYRVVGLVVGPKGATIKRIQQQVNIKFSFCVIQKRLTCSTNVFDEKKCKQKIFYDPFFFREIRVNVKLHLSLHCNFDEKSFERPVFFTRRQGNHIFG